MRLKTQWAHFPYNNGLDQFDFSFQPSIDECKLRELADLSFLECKENVLLLGPPGVGKTHLAIALDTEAIVAGQSVYFVTMQEMVVYLKLWNQRGLSGDVVVLHPSSYKIDFFQREMRHPGEKISDLNQGLVVRILFF